VCIVLVCATDTSVMNSVCVLYARHVCVCDDIVCACVCLCVPVPVCACVCLCVYVCLYCCLYCACVCMCMCACACVYAHVYQIANFTQLNTHPRGASLRVRTYAVRVCVQLYTQPLKRAGGNVCAMCVYVCVCVPVFVGWGGRRRLRPVSRLRRHSELSPLLSIRPFPH
jgi:hypothetical protein